jgi:guanylate kinase
VGPSGVGKNTLIARVLPAVPSLRFVPSLTTRPARAGESQGNPYVFVSEEEFSRALAEGDLLEWQEIHGRRYGTSRRVIESTLAEGHAAITDIDVLGSVRAAAALGRRCVTIFLRPASLSVLEERIRGRDPSIGGEELALRLARAGMEMELGYACDFQVVNDDLDAAVARITAIVESELERGAGGEARLVELDVRGADWGHRLRILLGSAETPAEGVARGVRCLWWEAHRRATAFAVPPYAVDWEGERRAVVTVRQAVGQAAPRAEHRGPAPG